MPFATIKIEAEETGEIRLNVEGIPTKVAIHLLTEAAMKLTLEQSDVPEGIRTQIERAMEGTVDHTGHGCPKDPTLAGVLVDSDETIIAPSFGELGGLTRSLRRQRELREEPVGATADKES